MTGDISTENIADYIENTLKGMDEGYSPKDMRMYRYLQDLAAHIRRGEKLRFFPY